jgi:starch-binding outer membrane protein, SusD/RagB family
MKSNFKYKTSLVCCLLLFVGSCTSDIDGVVNRNDPNKPQVLAKGSDLVSVLAGGFVAWWQASSRELYPALAVSGDIATCSWGNYGMRILSNEPRNSIPNTNSWSSSLVMEQPWGGYYSAASSSSDIITSLNSGVKFLDKGVDQSNSIKATAYFLRGISLGYLGLLFDKAVIIDENTDPLAVAVISNYKDMVKAALADLKKSMEISAAGKFELPKEVINGYTLDNDELFRLANSYSARFIVQGARNQAETNSIDWNIVKGFAEKGIQKDFGPVGDNGISWWSYVSALANTANGFEEAGGRLDMRIVQLMDPSQPTFYPTTADIKSSKATTLDKRLTTDFQYFSTNEFLPARGKYHWSHYISNRYVTDPNFSDGGDKKRLVTFAKADNDMLLAEANARLGNLAAAITIINNGTRVTRGNLAAIAVSANQGAVLDAVFYERYIELFNTAVGSGFFDRRRTNQLQIGTFRHLPIPAKILNVLGLPLYTFGGATNDPTGMVPHYKIENNQTRNSDANLPTFN